MRLQRAHMLVEAMMAEMPVMAAHLGIGGVQHARFHVLNLPLARNLDPALARICRNRRQARARREQKQRVALRKWSSTWSSPLSKAIEVAGRMAGLVDHGCDPSDARWAPS